MRPRALLATRSRTWALAALLLGLMVAVAACGGSSRPSSTGSSSSSSTAPSSSASAPPPSGGSSPAEQATPPPAESSASQAAASGSIELVATDEGGQFRFLPDRIQVQPGQTVTLRVVNRGASAHDLAVPDLRVETGQIDPGQEKTLTFTAPSTPGEYRFICTVPGHEQLGMRGTLVVQR